MYYDLLFTRNLFNQLMFNTYTEVHDARGRFCADYRDFFCTKHCGSRKADYSVGLLAKMADCSGPKF